MLNVDQKNLSKTLAGRLKKILPKLISPGQTAYVENRFFRESGRLIADILETCDREKLEGLLLAIDIEKAFDSLEHDILIAVLEKYGFGGEFLNWIKILLNDQQSCVINGGHTTRYFKLERGMRQGDPISAYLFILALEVFFILVKSDKNVHGLSIFEHEFLYTAYADDTTFFLKDLNSVKAVLGIANIYSKFSGLYPNLSKCEIAGIGVLKGANVALCGMKTLNLVNESIKILGIHISYNKSLQNDLNFCETVKNMCNVLNLWKMRHLTIEGKITVFKSLAISKIVYLSLLTSVPKSITDELKIIQKSFLWGKKKPKIKHQTLCNDFKDEGLKNVDIEHKIESLKCSWIKRLYDENFHEWKIIPNTLHQQNIREEF